MKPFLALTFLILSASLLLAQATLPAEKKEKKQYSAAPEMKIDPNKKYTATIDTDKGKIVLELFAKEAPKTVNNFVFLAKEGFYDDVLFHRVIPGFMIQTGDPEGTGGGGPGYTFENENKDSKRTFKPGTLAMANRGPDTNGSQFFINDADSPWLTPDKYTIFGQTTEGLDVVKQIANAPRDGSDRPNDPIHIKTITIKEQ
jgi:cyclophilin family peptidyl-prolyl cis-trans isomerase